jgi:RNA polymerase sigma-70 factor (ECF subfamily)
MHEPDETQLVRQSLAGDTRAFAELVRLHQDVAVNLARRMVGNRADGEDVAQEAFLRAFRNLRRFDCTREFRLWLLGITAHLARNHIRGRWRRQLREQQAAPPLASEPAADPRLLALEEAMTTLDPDSRGILTLKYMEGYTLEEIAAILGIRAGAVKMRLSRARERLLSLLPASPGETT